MFCIRVRWLRCHSFSWRQRRRDWRLVLLWSHDDRHPSSAQAGGVFQSRGFGERGGINDVISHPWVIRMAPLHNQQPKAAGEIKRKKKSHRVLYHVWFLNSKSTSLSYGWAVTRNHFSPSKSLSLSLSLSVCFSPFSAPIPAPFSLTALVWLTDETTLTVQGSCPHPCGILDIWLIKYKGTDII